MTEYVELHKWWNRDRNDNYTTTHPEWRGREGERRDPPGYGFAGVEGRIISPEVSRPPAGTKPLYSWWSDHRKDNYCTTHPDWAGDPGDRIDAGGYGFHRVEGYVFIHPIAGTIPLYTWYSHGRKDHHTTTLPGWLPNQDEMVPPNYRSYRLEGYILPPEDTPARGEPEFVGYRSDPISGSRPLLVYLFEHSDAPLPNDDAYYDNLIFGPDYPNLVDYFSEISGGRFTFTRAGLYRISFNQPRSVISSNAAYETTIINFIAGTASRRARRIIANPPPSPSFNFARFDANGDGIVNSSELAVLRINANPGGCTARTNGFPLIPGASPEPVSVPGVTLRLRSSNCDEAGDITLYAHELLHQLGIIADLYGTGNFHKGATVAGMHYCQGELGAGPVHMDPWHNMQHGWAQPRVIPITRAQGVAFLQSAQGGPKSPLVFYDPKRGGNDLFLVEYRTKNTAQYPTGSYDAGALGQGVAIWYVKRAQTGGLARFNWPPPITPNPSGNMFADYLVAPDGPAGTSFWTPANGEFSLNWDDGTDSGLRLQVGLMGATSNQVAVQWRVRGNPFRPRIDFVTPARISESDSEHMTWTMYGLFPARGRLQIVLENVDDHSIQYRLSDVAEGGYGLDRVFARSERRVPPGVYYLYVIGESPGRRSNGAIVEIV